MPGLIENSVYFVEKLKGLQARIRKAVSEHIESHSVEDSACIARKGGGDVVYKLDVPAEEIILEFCREWGKEKSFVLVAEGFNRKVFPENANEKDCEFVLIIDPIDGTRPLMYDLRSAWSLAGIAPNNGAETMLSDIEIAVQTELPTTKQNVSEVLWAVKGGGAKAELVDVRQNKVLKEFVPQSSAAKTIRNGFFVLKNFFLYNNIFAAKAEQLLLEEEFSGMEDNCAIVFEDQYISSGGQLYCLATGKYRGVCDLRPWLKSFAKPGENFCLMAHPYDVCTELIAKEAGAIITGINGESLKDKLDTESSVLWIGYANQAIRERIEPKLLRILKELKESAKAGTLKL